MRALELLPSEFTPMLLFRYADSNMAGSVWAYSFFLTWDKRSDTYSLSMVPEGDDDPPHCPPVEAIKDGAELQERFSSMLQQLGVDESYVDRERVAEALAAISSQLANEFLSAEETLESRDQAEREADVERRKMLLTPFRTVIDAYVTSTPDSHTRAGGIRVSGRHFLKLFIEDYVLAHGHLPEGAHRIRVETGGLSYSGGLHDFTALRLAPDLRTE